MSCNLAYSIGFVVSRDEVDIALLQERMMYGFEVGGDHVDFEHCALFAPEDEAHADDQCDGQHDRVDESAAVADELQVAGVPYGQHAFDHARNSLPVSSRKRSSRFGGRMRK